jgi:hypothetical protein
MANFRCSGRLSAPLTMTLDVQRKGEGPYDPVEGEDGSDDSNRK